ncbi:uncharacterized protein PSFLO_04958 [Pseudozyma flocculosa]|uniref:Uncharacterized protein n=1 Tax=Pseudozyma flocculosa TaxID=84751 RepID=A0A5C3F701_9BASI|nr:uncharacterized protein PSFLO_04958 [Pseudozyma flocculosa]
MSTARLRNAAPLYRDPSSQHSHGTVQYEAQHPIRAAYSYVAARPSSHGGPPTGFLREGLIRPGWPTHATPKRCQNAGGARPALAPHRIVSAGAGPPPPPPPPVQPRAVGPTED